MHIRKVVRKREKVFSIARMSLILLEKNEFPKLGSS